MSSTPETVKAQLQADIATANAATGKQDATMHDAVASLIEGFGQVGGEEIFYTANTKAMYTRNMVYNRSQFWGNNMFEYANEMESFTATAVTRSDVYGFRAVANCPKLKSVLMPIMDGCKNPLFFNDTALELAQIGSIGHAISSMSSATGFQNCTNPNLVITLYVDANAIAEIPLDLTQYAPWGAINATIIYRNSTTGEVISE